MNRKWKYISVNPKICGGKPCFRDTRIPVVTVLNYLAAGDSVETVLKCYPDLTKKHVQEALALAASLVSFEEVDIPA
jgi:uncharacterized protein (DUF433 family)